MPEFHNSPFIAVIIILYFPDDETLDFIENFNRTGAKIVVVVNAIEQSKSKRLSKSQVWKTINNDSNLGLAKALNQGCAFAFENGASHVFLLDQDSRPDFRLHEELAHDLATLSEKYINIGAIGPSLVDVKGSDSGLPPATESATIVETLATSGTLISREAYDIVGSMNEWLFIDCIDHEWCFRASAKGFAVLQASRRKMLHDMGDRGITIFGRYRPLHRSPIRHYYILRNTMFLVQQPYASLSWRIREALKLIYRVPIYLLISTDTKASARYLATAFKEVILEMKASKSDKT